MLVELRQIALINIEYLKWYSLISDQSQGQLSAARAAQLAAQRTELPVLAQVRQPWLNGAEFYVWMVLGGN